MREDTAHYPPVDPFATGLKGCCPRCGQGKLYGGVLALKPRCAACGLDYGFADSGDGPAVFVILILGFLVVGLALWFEFTFHPPVWLHVLLWGPLTIGGAILMLRALKGVLIALQYRNSAAEGQIER